MKKFTWWIHTFLILHRVFFTSEFDFVDHHINRFQIVNSTRRLKTFETSILPLISIHLKLQWVMFLIKRPCMYTKQDNDSWQLTWFYQIFMNRIKKTSQRVITLCNHTVKWWMRGGNIYKKIFSIWIRTLQKLNFELSFDIKVNSNL